MNTIDKFFVIKLLNHGVQQWFSENVDGSKSLECKPEQIIDDRVYAFQKKLKNDIDFINIIELDDPKMTDDDADDIIDFLYRINKLKRRFWQECGNCEIGDECHCVYDNYSATWLPESWIDACERKFGGAR